MVTSFHTHSRPEPSVGYAADRTPEHVSRGPLVFDTTFHILETVSDVVRMQSPLLDEPHEEDGCDDESGNDGDEDGAASLTQFLR